MQDHQQLNKILFINGVNTKFGGSVKGAIKIWQASFKNEKIDCEIFNTIPDFNLESKSLLYKLLLAIYFIPGTFFRLFKQPIFELSYKFSPFLIIQFFRAKIRVNPSKIIFSHHSIFFLGIFVKKIRRIFLIQDLIYIRAKSKGASRRVLRLYFAIELFIYRHAHILFVISYHEHRVLRNFLPNQIYLIKSWGKDTYARMPSYDCSEIAVISDWRRYENIHGALNYFTKDFNHVNFNEKIQFCFYGFDSNKIVSQIKSLNLSSELSIVNGGTFRNISDIREGFFFVPIYQGAGIKLKTIEALASKRFVIGTNAAFIGLPPWIISKVIKITESLNDFPTKIESPEGDAFIKAIDSLSLHFIEIGKVSIFHNRNI
jgi:hypothetical protein